MMPIPGLEQIKIQWLLIEKGGYKLYGFLLYTGTDTVLVEYLKEGLIDLDILSGDECVIFLIEPPSKKWINYTKKKNHNWLKLFPQRANTRDDKNEKQLASLDDKADAVDQLLKMIISNVSDSTIVIGNNNTISLEHLLDPQYDELYDRSEALEVAKHFHLSAANIPCLIFFKDIDSDLIWSKSLVEYTNNAQLNSFFRVFFESEDFKSLLKF